MTLAEARALRLPIGIHKGETLESILANDKPYLLWLTAGPNRLKKHYHEAIVIVLAATTPAEDPNQSTLNL